MLRSYLRLVLFAFGLLVGVQVPGVILDYTQRVEAHLIEARESLSGFNDTAARFFNGDLQALIQHYRSSSDPVFQNDAASIDNLQRRHDLLDHEWQVMQGPWYQRAWHVLVAADPALRDETLKGYSYQVVLTPEAIGWGLALALFIAWGIEILFVLINMLATGGKVVRPDSWR